MDLRSGETKARNRWFSLFTWFSYYSKRQLFLLGHSQTGKYTSRAPVLVHAPGSRVMRVVTIID